MSTWDCQKKVEEDVKDDGRRKNGTCQFCITQTNYRAVSSVRVISPVIKVGFTGKREW